jgi:hypothetical protein
MTVDGGTALLTPSNLDYVRSEDDCEGSEDETLFSRPRPIRGIKSGNRVRTERSTLCNTTKQQALQLNAALGKTSGRTLPGL